MVVYILEQFALESIVKRISEELRQRNPEMSERESLILAQQVLMSISSALTLDEVSAEEFHGTLKKYSDNGAFADILRNVEL